MEAGRKKTDDLEQFGYLRSAKELRSFLKGREFRHTGYYHYTDMNAARSILSTGIFWISPMVRSNDWSDRTCFGADTYRMFQLCFTTGTTENLPLWFLYSGENGHGARVSLSKQPVQQLFQQGFELTLVRDSGHDRHTLHPGRDCRVEFRDVLYLQREDKKYRLKYNTRTNTDFPKGEMEQFQRDYRGFCKDLVWFYEKETRLLVEVDEGLLDRRLYDPAAPGRYSCRVELQLPEDIHRQIKATLSPKYMKGSKELEEALKADEFRRFHSDELLSKYQSKVYIDMCAKCSKCSRCEIIEKRQA